VGLLLKHVHLAEDPRPALACLRRGAAVERPSAQFSSVGGGGGGGGGHAWLGLAWAGAPYHPSYRGRGVGGVSRVCLLLEHPDAVLDAHGRLLAGPGGSMCVSGLGLDAMPRVVFFVSKAHRRIKGRTLYSTHMMDVQCDAGGTSHAYRQARVRGGAGRSALPQGGDLPRVLLLHGHQPLLNGLHKCGESAALLIKDQALQLLHSTSIM
jgi:hypothetical protein